MTDPGPNLKREPPKFEFGFHSLAEMFPLIEGKDLDALADDIRANGLLEPITVKDKSVLDGRNRYLACQKAGYAFKESDFRELGVEVDPLVFVISKNIQRRHLTPAQKREIIALLVSKHPQASSRQIAGIAHVSHHTVEEVRKETGQSAQLRTGADGKKRKIPGRRKGSKHSQTTPRRLREQLEKFKAEWGDLNDYQKRGFVKEFIDELRELVEEMEFEKEREQEQEQEEEAA
jgi:ParB-like nuclease domain